MTKGANVETMPEPKPIIHYLNITINHYTEVIVLCNRWLGKLAEASQLRLLQLNSNVSKLRSVFRSGHWPGDRQYIWDDYNNPIRVHIQVWLFYLSWSIQGEEKCSACWPRNAMGIRTPWGLQACIAMRNLGEGNSWNGSLREGLMWLITWCVYGSVTTFGNS